MKPAMPHKNELQIAVAHKPEYTCKQDCVCRWEPETPGLTPLRFVVGSVF